MEVLKNVLQECHTCENEWVGKRRETEPGTMRFLLIRTIQKVWKFDNNGHALPC